MKENVSPIPSSYWKTAAKNFTDLRTVVFAAMVVAMRVAVKSLRIPVAAGLYITFDCYVNAIGSIVYGPLVALAVGAVSDTVGAILFPSGPYFFPFIVVEMLSSFLFALFFWRRKVTPTRALAAKFSVNFLCNIVLNSVLMKWYYAVLYPGKVYQIVNLTRIVKNLVMFPLEAVLIVYVLSAVIPLLRRLKLTDASQDDLRMKPKDFAVAGVLTLLSAGLVVFYAVFLKDWIAANNIKFW